MARYRFTLSEHVTHEVVVEASDRDLARVIAWEIRDMDTLVKCTNFKVEKVEVEVDGKFLELK